VERRYPVQGQRPTGFPAPRKASAHRRPAAPRTAGTAAFWMWWGPPPSGGRPPALRAPA